MVRFLTAWQLRRIVVKIASSLSQHNWQCSFEAASDLVVVAFSDPFSLHSIPAVQEEISSGPWSKCACLLDFSRCTLSPTTTELLQAGKIVANWDGRNELKSGWLASSQRDVGLLRIVLGRISDQVMKVFLSESEARRWLSGEQEIVEPRIRDSHVPTRLRGKFSLDEVIDRQQLCREQPDYDASRPILWDLRESSALESLNEVQSLAVYIAANHNRDRAGCRSAILIDTHLMGLMIREMARVPDWPSADLEVFRSYRETLAWLGVAKEKE